MFTFSGCRDLAEEREPRDTGKAGCCLETFNVRIGMTLKQTADGY